MLPFPQHPRLDERRLIQMSIEFELDCYSPNPLLLLFEEFRH
jgi:hypothetical protein